MTVLCSFPYHNQSLEISSYKAPFKKKIAAHKEGVLRSPGSGQIDISPIQLSSPQNAPSKLATITAAVKGSHIAHIYAEILIHDTSRNLFFGPLWQAFVRADTEKEVKGVVYPNWAEENHIEFKYPGTLRLLEDGNQCAFAYLTPERYSGAEEFSVRGVFTSKANNKQFDAHLTFDGEKRFSKLVVRRGGEKISPPRSISPQAGDMFQPFVQIFTPAAGDTGNWVTKTGISNSLTFGKMPLSWNDVPSLTGTYVLGFAVKDMDGKITRQHAAYSIID